MSIIQDILDYNGEFVKGKEYETFVSSKFPDKKIAVVTCMDTRLTELLPAAMNFKNGDIKIIKTAGGIITHPFGSVMRSLLIAVYELGVEDIIIIGHHECGMQSIDSELMVEKMKERGIF